MWEMNLIRISKVLNWMLDLSTSQYHVNPIAISVKLVFAKTLHDGILVGNSSFCHYKMKIIQIIYYLNDT